MDIKKPVYKSNSPEYKEELKKKKVKDYSDLEDFVESEGFKEYFKLLTNAIVAIENNILTDLSEDTHKPLYSMKTVLIKLRQELIKLRNAPIHTLKLLSNTIDKLGSTE